MRGKDLSEALLTLASIASPTDVIQLQGTVREQFGTYIGMSLMPTNMLNDRGMTVGITPSTAPEGMNGRDLQIQAEMYSQADRVLYPAVVQGSIEPAKRMIAREHPVTPESFFELVAHNPMVPVGREYIFARGLSAWVHGDLTVAVHLLVPQLEHSLRSLLERAGAMTTTLSQEGLQGDHTLGSVLAARQIEEILDEDTSFDLRCLLIERFGANLRNLVAHGLAEYGDVHSPSASYLCWMVLHLCARPVLTRAGTEDSDEAEPGA